MGTAVERRRADAAPSGACCDLRGRVSGRSSEDGDLGRQIIRDWVLAFNALEPADRPGAGTDVAAERRTSPDIGGDHRSGTDRIREPSRPGYLAPSAPRRAKPPGWSCRNATPLQCRFISRKFPRRSHRPPPRGGHAQSSRVPSIKKTQGTRQYNFAAIAAEVPET